VGDLAVNNVWSDVEGNEAPYGSFPVFPFFVMNGDLREIFETIRVLYSFINCRFIHAM
jgi:hypothetical protein